MVIILLFRLVSFDLVLYGMMRGYCPDVLSCKISSFSVENWHSYGRFSDIWYYLDVLPCKICSFYLENWYSYGCFSDLVLYGMMCRFSDIWFGMWVTTLGIELLLQLKMLKSGAFGLFLAFCHFKAKFSSKIGIFMAFSVKNYHYL